MKLVKTDFYGKKERKFFKKHPDLLGKYAQALKALAVEPFDSSLKTHKLKGHLKEFHACSLTYEYRLVFILLIQDDKLTLVDIGTHDEVYRGS